ncbi:Asp23/Gls24 family envelope stress response protein [Atopobacter sp. AH10]|uniref:Asp23/Gls24 family envelope stress response protein n=1 Tax=Atopobacter sp. AH10 TaxID=2315861 RepID=UPI000EF1B06E|nr:Asp23/Gls24 family envelope stress response protein [Atopobacter sp. AH10]RLK62530.1 Asp23/Gls24 family envelope stress response protein [Atopobacter sp. AH10]
MTDLKDTLIEKKTDAGDILLNPDSIETIASITARQVEGVSHLMPGIMGEFSEFWTRKTGTTGAHLSGDQDHLVIDLSVALLYGYSIPKIALEIQEKIKEQILNSCDLNIQTVNVHVKKIVSEKEVEQPILDLEEE